MTRLPCMTRPWPQSNERVRGGPTFIEAMTYRLVGHMVGDSERITFERGSGRVACA